MFSSSSLRLRRRTANHAVCRRVVAAAGRRWGVCRTEATRIRPAARCGGKTCHDVALTSDARRKCRRRAFPTIGFMPIRRYSPTSATRYSAACGSSSAARAKSTSPSTAAPARGRYGQARRTAGSELAARYVEQRGTCEDPVEADGWQVEREEVLVHHFTISLGARHGGELARAVQADRLVAERGEPAQIALDRLEQGRDVLADVMIGGAVTVSHRHAVIFRDRDCRDLLHLHWHCHVNRRQRQRTTMTSFQAAALAQSHTLKTSVRNRLSVDRLSK